MLIEELEAQREARTQRSVSLVESLRQKEIEEQRADREQRDEIYRAAFGISGSGDDAEGEGTPDIILNEAAQVLNDIIDYPPII